MKVRRFTVWVIAIIACIGLINPVIHLLISLRDAWSWLIRALQDWWELLLMFGIPVGLIIGLALLHDWWRNREFSRLVNECYDKDKYEPES